jgi:hypothetical protein
VSDEVILQILRRSSQGFTPFEILDYLLALPQYQGRSRSSTFAELLPVLQRLRDSQVVAHVSPRWVLVGAQENSSEGISDESKDAVSPEETNETEAPVTLNRSDEDLFTNLQEWTPQVGDKVLVKDRGTTIFTIDSFIYIGREKYVELIHSNYPNLPKLRKLLSEIYPVGNSNLSQEFLEKTDAESLIESQKNTIAVSINNYNTHSEDSLSYTEVEIKFSGQAPNSVNNDVELDFPIILLNLSLRAYNCLKRYGINTIRELKNCSEEDLLSIKGFGQTLLAEVRSVLATFQPPLQLLQAQEVLLPQSVQTQEVPLLPKWASLPGMQISTCYLAVSPSLYKIISKYLTVAHLIYEFEAERIVLDSHEDAEIQDAITPFQALRDASGDYLDWLASLSKSTLIEVLTKHQWTADKLKELSLRQILSAISSDARETTHKAIISGRIPSKSFTTIAEEIDGWFYPLKDQQKSVLKQRLGLQSGNLKSLADIGREMGVSRERVRQIEDKVTKKLNAINNGSTLLKIRQIAIEALHSAGCINTLQEWCEDIAQIYPPGEVHLPSVILWIIDFIPEIHTIQISAEQFFYITPFTNQVFENIQAQLTEFWKEQRISERSQLHQIIVPLLPQDILNYEQVADTLINTCCNEQLPGVFSAEEWDFTDYAYYILHESEKPLHFKEVCQGIEQIKPEWKAKNIERAVHARINVNRDLFYRCGQGIYALREWGTMEYSHFREVLLDYLSKQSLPVDPEDIYGDLSQLYSVTCATVSMNLNLHPNLFQKFGRSNFYGVAGRRYELPEQNLINLLVAKLESGPVSLSDLKQDADLGDYDFKTIYLYLNVSPLFCQTASMNERKFALSIEGKRQYEPGDISKLAENIFNQIREPLHARDFLHLIRNYYAYPPGESAFWRALSEGKDYINITEAIFILRNWMSDETLSPILEDLDTELFREIVLFTLGSKRQQPTSETLFNWLNFCYRNRFFYRGSLIFAQINPSELPDKKADMARKIGQVCQRNGDTSVLAIGQNANTEEVERILRLDLEELRQQAQSGQRTPSKRLASIPDGKYRVRYVAVGVEVHLTKWGGTDNPCAKVLKVLVNGEPFDPGRHNPIPTNTAPIDKRREALKKLYEATLTAYAQVDPYLQVATGPRPSWGGVGYRNMEPITEPATGDST